LSSIVPSTLLPTVPWTNNNTV